MKYLIGIIISLVAGILVGVFSGEGFEVALVVFIMLSIAYSLFYYAAFSARKAIESQEKYNELKEKGIEIFSGLNYIGGHHSYSNTEPVVFLTLDNDILKTTSQIRNTLLFSISVQNITNVSYELSEDISAARALALGLSAMIFKKKTYYLLIEYVTEKNIKNVLVFETGSKKNIELINKLNVARNEFAEPQNIKNSETDNIEERLIKLNELKDRNLITEEEYNKKRESIISKL